MKKKKQQQNVMVFGVFDRFHLGHLSFLLQARRHGKVIVAVARDNAVGELKKKKPRQNEQDRARALKKLPFISRVLLGDKRQGSYGILKKYKPNIICLGYDQDMLARDLTKKMQKKLLPGIPLIRLTPYRPNKFHTSLMSSSRRHSFR